MRCWEDDDALDEALEPAEILVGRLGIVPRTNGLHGRCSPIWSPRSRRGPCQPLIAPRGAVGVFRFDNHPELR